MAAIYFCGATGKVFRGSAKHRTEWLKCQESERPPGDPSLEGTDKAFMNSCLSGSVCPLYLTGWRNSNSEPYRWAIQTRQGLRRRKIIVAGGGFDRDKLRENRLECGRRVRARLRRRSDD